MLEENLPAVWSSIHSWFTPTTFFILLNLVIGTIAFTSKSPKHHHSDSSAASDAGYGGGDRRSFVAPLARAPSLVLDRLKSFNLSHFVPRYQGDAGQPTADPAAEPAGGDRRSGRLTRGPSIVLDRLRSFELSRFVSGEVQVRTETVEPEPVESVSHQQFDSDQDHDQEHHLERSISDALPPKKKPLKHMKKSASNKSSFDHFTASEILQTDLEEEDCGVDAKADDFINKFKNQLKLQRMNSIIRYKEMLTRGAEN